MFALDGSKALHSILNTLIPLSFCFSRLKGEWRVLSTCSDAASTAITNMDLPFKTRTESEFGSSKDKGNDETLQLMALYTFINESWVSF
jgi:hypothetical protein